MLITAAALFMILVPWNIRNTIAVPEFVTYMGIGQSQILTNASSVGMGMDPDDPSACLISDPGLLREDLFVSDIIYQPRQTRLLKLARERGCRTANGLLMLLYQGAEAFRLWTGQQMPVQAIRERFFAG